MLKFYSKSSVQAFVYNATNTLNFLKEELYNIQPVSPLQTTVK